MTDSQIAPNVQALPEEPTEHPSFRTELFVGFVAPTGVGFDAVSGELVEQLRNVGYRTEKIRVSDYLRAICGKSDEELTAYDERIRILQDAGDELRKLHGPDALASVAIAEIRKRRRAYWRAAGESRGEDDPVPATAYLIWSFKHPQEVDRLRRTYLSRFFLISAFSPRARREESLAAGIAKSRNERGQEPQFRSLAIKTIDRDEWESIDKEETDGRKDQADQRVRTDYGQDVREAYPLAHYFMDASSDLKIKSATERIIQILFGYPFATPTRDEYGMYVAHAAMLRSAEMGRQVGASIASSAGDVIATGTNDVPAPLGGHYWSGDTHDAREFTLGYDTNDAFKRQLAEQIVARLTTKKLIHGDSSDRQAAVLDLLNKTRVHDVIEYTRALHGEMSALMDAARRGVAVAGATMFVTTFPCHLCTRLIIGAGIVRVIYLYPYPKSLALQLHSDAICTDAADPSLKRVLFQGFLGVAPAKYPDVFAAIRRKDGDGTAVKWHPELSGPRLPDVEEDLVDYVLREQLVVAESTWLDLNH